MKNNNKRKKKGKENNFFSKSLTVFQSKLHSSEQRKKKIYNPQCEHRHEIQDDKAVRRSYDEWSFVGTATRSKGNHLHP